ncbi:lipopolysaccharide biosynthesis protein [Chromatiaceae bacterium AAb-1]|nr:lipopolysaccharide biosynthesis protein [Chromatiaceae bacterium AAb-1]
MNTVRQSLFLSFAQKYSELLINLAANIILARLLLPEEVGLYSVIATLTILAHMFRDFGVSSFIVREPELSPALFSASFLVTLLWSYSMGAILLLSSGLIAAFFDRAELIAVVQVVSLTFFIIPFGSVWLSLLRKQMNFAALFKIHFCSALFGSATSVLLAYQGFSYMSLAWGSLAATLTTVVGSNFYRPAAPFCWPDKNSLLRVMSFGSKASYISVLHQTVNQLPEILIGKYYGMANTGLYSRANGIVKLFHMGVMQGLLPVLLPHFVNKLKASGDLSQEYLKVSRSMCTLAWPFFAFLTLMSEDIIALLFGANWLAAAPLVTWLALCAAIESLYSLNNNVFISLNRMNEAARNHSWVQGIAFILLLAGAWHSLTGLFIALTASRVIAMLISAHFLGQVTGLNLRQLCNNQWPALVVTLCSAIPLLLCLPLLAGFSSTFIRLILAGVLYSVCWLTALWLVKSVLFTEIRLLADKLRTKTGNHSG